MIELTNVTKRYGRKGTGTEALREVSLALSVGSIWAVVGPNGAGKSTLLSLILGFIRPSEGRVTIAGESPRDYLREVGAAYLPERFSLPGRWRTGDALRMLARMEGAGRPDAERAIDLLGLGQHLDRHVGQLSRGLLQRLGLAQALLTPRALVVLDEPTEGLDPVWRVRLRDIIDELRSEERTIIIASHDLSELERIADHALVLDRGTIRDVLDVRTRTNAVEYRLLLAAPIEGVGDAFPGAAQLDELQYLVRVTDPGDLSQRLGGLLSMGAVLTAVEPVRVDLEQRVQTALDLGPADTAARDNPTGYDGMAGGDDGTGGNDDMADGDNVTGGDDESGRGDARIASDNGT